MEESNKIEIQTYNKVKKQKNLVICLCVILCLISCILGYYVINLDPEFSKDSLWQFVSFVLLSFIPICAVYVVNYFFITRDKEEYTKYETKEIFYPINTKMDEMLQKMHLESKGLEKIMYSSEDPPWNLLLNEAEELHLCLFYVNKDWIDKNERAFKSFVDKGGTLNVYLPDPKNVKSRYFSKSEIEPRIQDEIISSFLFFKSLDRKKNGNIKLKQISQGLNYVFAKIKYSEKALYYMSPYSNASSEGLVPKFLFNNTLPEELNHFFVNELKYLMNNSEEFIDVEKKRYFILKKDRNTVYLSTGLVCNSPCKFCYSESLIKDHRTETYDPKDIARILCKMIDSDDRIIRGVNGTTIMLGGYNDPFNGDHFDSTLLILKTLAKYENPVHIATRHHLSDDQVQELPAMKNLVINYSISSFPADPAGGMIELGNQENRFQTAESLVKRGINVALFIRPVIKDVTLRDLERILDYSGMAGIEVITVGGLYYDNKIEEALRQSNVVIDKKDVIKKKFVLSEESDNALKKTCNTEVDRVMAGIYEYNTKKNTSFRVFRTAKERVIHFKNFAGRRRNDRRNRS